MPQRISLLLLIVLSIHSFVFSQSQIQGTVIDAETGAPVPGVLVYSTIDSTYTSPLGSFSLPATDSYNVQSLGYESKKVLVSNNSNLVTLQPKIYALEGLVVTSFLGKKEQSNSAVTVNTITKRDLNNFTGTTVMPALNLQPGVFMQSGALNTNRIAIRGIGARSPFSTNRIRAYLGEIPLTNGTGETTIEDIDLSFLGRLEIIKGPSATLYGSGLGGVMLLYPERSEATSQLQVDQTVGSFGLRKTDAKLTYAKGGGIHKVIYSNLHSDGYRDNNEVDRQVVGILSSTYEEKAENHFIGYYLSQKAFIPSSIDREAFENDPRSAAFTWAQSQGNEDYERALLGYSRSQQINSELTYHAAVFGSYFLNDEDRPFNILDENTFGLGTRGRLAYSNGPFQWFVGTELFIDWYNWSTFENLFEDFSGVGSVRGDIIQQNRERRQYVNVFTEASYQFGKTSLSIGANFNRTTYSLTNLVSPDGDDPSGSFTYDPAFTPKVGITHSFKPWLKAFASISEGFSTPSLEETLNPDGAINTAIRPERGVSYEAGVRINRGRWATEITLYRMNIRNLLVARRTAEDAFVGINAGRTKHNGIEAILKGNLIQSNNWQLDGRLSYALNQFEFTDFVDEELDQDFSGNDLTGFPTYQFTSQLTLSFLSKGSLTLTSQSVGEIPITDDNSTKSDPYHVVFGKLNWTEKIGPLAIKGSAGINNLFDENYASMVAVNARGFGGRDPRFFYPGLPRNYYGQLSLTYSF